MASPRPVRSPLRAPLLFLLFAILALLPTSTVAQNAAPTIYRPASKYVYHGCYNETTALEGTTKDRALDGPGKVLDGTMTVQACLDFCSTNGNSYKYAGLEFSRECWCGQKLSGLSVKSADSECSTACDGDKSTICGGPMKLSVYISRAGHSSGVAVGLAALVAVTATIFGNLI